MRKLRVVVLMHDYLVPPEDVSGHDLMTVQWKTEHDVLVTLREMGHDVRPVGIKDDLTVIRRAVEEFKPHIAFNMMENFREVGAFDHNVVSYLELLRVPYTGCNPRGLMLARDKALSKTLLSYHRIPVPDFVVVRLGRTAPTQAPRLPADREVVDRGGLDRHLALFESDSAARGAFEDRTFGAYARLNEERRTILDRIADEGTVYGR